jgi:hypothetical protein
MDGGHFRYKRALLVRLGYLPSRYGDLVFTGRGKQPAVHYLSTATESC